MDTTKPLYIYTVHPVGDIHSFTMQTASPLSSGDVVIHAGREYKAAYIIHAVAHGITPIAVVRWIGPVDV